jgi:hypothetical protein
MDNKDTSKETPEVTPVPVSVNSALAAKARPLPRVHMDFIKNVLKKEPKNLEDN